MENLYLYHGDLLKTPVLLFATDILEADKLFLSKTSIQPTKVLVQTAIRFLTIDPLKLVTKDIYPLKKDEEGNLVVDKTVKPETITISNGITNDILLIINKPTFDFIMQSEWGKSIVKFVVAGSQITRQQMSEMILS